MKKCVISHSQCVISPIFLDFYRFLGIALSVRKRVNAVNKAKFVAFLRFLQD